MVVTILGGDTTDLHHLTPEPNKHYHDQILTTAPHLVHHAVTSSTTNIFIGMQKYHLIKLHHCDETMSFL